MTLIRLLFPEKSFKAVQSKKISDGFEIGRNILQGLSADDKSPHYQGKN